MKTAHILIAAFFFSILHPMYAQKLVLTEPVHFLALGDSYTIGESVSPELSWPAQMVSELNKNGFTTDRFQIIAKTGWRTDQLIEAITIRNPKDFNLVSLLIGVNNQYQNRPMEEMQRDFNCLLAEAVTHAGGKKESVFILSIPDYAYTPFGQTRDKAKISRELDTYNAWQKARAAEEGIAWVDITSISRLGLEQPDLVAADGLHPSARQYSLWVRKIFDQIIP